MARLINNLVCNVCVTIGHKEMLRDDKKCFSRHPSKGLMMSLCFSCGMSAWALGSERRLVGSEGNVVFCRFIRSMRRSSPPLIVVSSPFFLTPSLDFNWVWLCFRAFLCLVQYDLRCKRMCIFPLFFHFFATLCQSNE